MRAIIMCGVLTVHTTTMLLSKMQDGSQAFLWGSAVHSTLHFTRMAFMFITGLVLFITYYRRDFNTIIFWKKRFLLIAIPYVFWNIIYILYSGTYNGSFLSFLHIFGHSLAKGDQGYLYYVLVTFQFYIIFPILLFFLRKWEKWHVHVFIIAFVFQLILMGYYKFFLPNMDTSAWPAVFKYIAGNYGVFVLTYESWFIAGGILACHFDAVCAYIAKHSKAIYITLASSVVVMWGHYFFNRFVLNETDHKAQMVEQPFFVPYSFVVIVFMLLISMNWARKREWPKWQPFSRFVMLASGCSFGMFLVQPIPLALLKGVLKHISGPSWLFYLLMPFSVLFVYLFSMVVAHWMGKIPLLSYCVGRRTSLPFKKTAREVIKNA